MYYDCKFEWNIDDASTFQFYNLVHVIVKIIDVFDTKQNSPVVGIYFINAYFNEVFFSFSPIAVAFASAY